MIGKICAGLALGTFVIATAGVPSASAASLKVRVDAIKDGGAIPTKYSFCSPTADGKMGAGS